MSEWLQEEEQGRTEPRPRNKNGLQFWMLMENLWKHEAENFNCNGYKINMEIRHHLFRRRTLCKRLGFFLFTLLGFPVARMFTLLGLHAAQPSRRAAFTLLGLHAARRSRCSAFTPLGLHAARPSHYSASTLLCSAFTLLDHRAQPSR